MVTQTQLWLEGIEYGFRVLRPHTQNKVPWNEDNCYLKNIRRAKDPFFSWNCGGKDNLKVQSYSDKGNWYGLKFEIILNE